MGRHPWVAECSVFLAFLIIYLPLQQGTVFADPDSFYHLKMAELTAAHGPVRSFLWMPFTTLAKNFADHHFLYHVSLIPFIKFFGPFRGMQLATLVFAAAAISTLAWALRRLGARYAALYATAAGLMSPLVFRIHLAKASSVAIVLLLVGIVFALERKAVPLGIVAFIYVWTHGGWPALVVCATVCVVITSFAETGALRSLVTWRSSGFKSLVALVAGTVAGIVVNPFFPQNLKFYWEQIVQIALVGYRDQIGVGGEWYPYGGANLVSDLPLVGILVATIVVLTFAHLAARRRIGSTERLVRSLALTLVAALFLILTLRSRRHVEYFVPTAVLAAAYLIDTLVRPFYSRIRDVMKASLPVSAFVIAGIGCMVVAFATQSLARTARDLHQGYGFDLYAGEAQYLSTHANKGEVVIHSDWDDFPPLFYHDSDQRYMMGLDPTFLYRANPDDYWLYVRFTLGESQDPIGVMKHFGARYVVMDRQHGMLASMLDRSGGFVKVYSDDDGYVYRLR